MIDELHGFVVKVRKDVVKGTGQGKIQGTGVGVPSKAIVKIVPLPGSLSTFMDPFMASTCVFTRYSPSPLPSEVPLSTLIFIGVLQQSWPFYGTTGMSCINIGFQFQLSFLLVIQLLRN